MKYEHNININKLSEMLDLWLHTDYCEEEGNSFFFTGGCLIFAESLIKFLLKDNKICRLIDISQGSHYAVEYESKFIDANGVFESLNQLIIDSGIDYTNDIVEYSVVFDSSHIEEFTGKDIEFYGRTIFDRYSRIIDIFNSRLKNGNNITNS